MNKVPLESTLQRKISKYLESLGCYVVKVVVANKTGVPDLVFCYDGKFMACEVKRKGLKRNVTKLQQYHIDLINKTGGLAFVADSLDDVKLHLHKPLDFLE